MKLDNSAQAPEFYMKEGRRIYRPKRCEYNNEDEDNNPNILNDKTKKNCIDWLIDWF